MNDFKMGDVFCCEVDASAFTVISGVVKEHADDSVMPHEYTAHAVNNHDRMVGEIAELKGALSSLIETSESNEQQLSDCILEIHNESTSLKISKALLAKLQKGEE